MLYRKYWFGLLLLALLYVGSQRESAVSSQGRIDQKELRSTSESWPKTAGFKKLDIEQIDVGEVMAKEGGHPFYRLVLRKELEVNHRSVVLCRLTADKPMNVTSAQIWLGRRPMYLPVDKVLYNHGCSSNLDLVSVPLGSDQPIWVATELDAGKHELAVALCRFDPNSPASGDLRLELYAAPIEKSALDSALQLKLSAECQPKEAADLSGKINFPKSGWLVLKPNDPGPTGGGGFFVFVDGRMICGNYFGENYQSQLSDGLMIFPVSAGKHEIHLCHYNGKDEWEDNTQVRSLDVNFIKGEFPPDLPK